MLLLSVSRLPCVTKVQDEEPPSVWEAQLRQCRFGVGGKSGLLAQRKGLILSAGQTTTSFLPAISRAIYVCCKM